MQITDRAKDVIKSGGEWISSIDLENLAVGHPKVAEAAVIGRSDELTGEAILAFVTPEGEIKGDEELESELREHVAEKIGKLARPKQIVFAGDLPKTRSGKIMRRLLRDIAAGNELGDVTTLRDPGVVEELQAQVASR
jgi:acetyl-CoA synthetase